MKALWAYEPFHQDNKNLQNMHRLLTSLTGNTAHIEIAFIATHTEPSLRLAFDISPKERFSTYPQEIIEEQLQDAKLKIDRNKIHVFDEASSSNTKTAKTLIKSAHKLNADLIALFTHARKGYKRLMLGSFAETLIHLSPQDILVLPPTTSSPTLLKTILFASDFEKTTTKDIEHILSICKSLKANLVVFHHANISYKESSQESSPKSSAYRRKVNEMKSWIEITSKKSKVSCEVLVKSDFKSVTEHIKSIVKTKKCDLIFVRAKASAKKTLMGGSITRAVVRESTLPVYILKN